jgi:hypothetical protein
LDVILDELVILGKVELGPKVEVALKVEGVDLDVLTRNVEFEDDIDSKVAPASASRVVCAVEVCAVEKHLDSPPTKLVGTTIGSPPSP